MVKIINMVFSLFSSISQIFGIIVVSYGMLKGFYIYVSSHIKHTDLVSAINKSRLELGQSFSLGLGFLIGASIIRTTLAPNWEDIGKLAAIIFIRTTMNFFLMKDTEKLKQEEG